MICFRDARPFDERAGLNLPSKNLNRNHSFCAPAQSAEKASFFAAASAPDDAGIPYLMNQWVKP